MLLRVGLSLRQNLSATLAALLGEDYKADVPEAGAQIADVLRARTNRPASASERDPGGEGAP